MSIITTDKKIIVEIASFEVRKMFEVSCSLDDGTMISRYLELKEIDPCINNYSILRYAIKMKAKNVVEKLLESDFFNEVSMDTKYSLKVASITGDDEFALYMLN